VTTTVLKSLASFEGLTEAEARVFEQGVAAKTFEPGGEVSPEDSLLVVERGTFGLTVDSGSGRKKLRSVERGGFLGEAALFLSDTVPVVAVAEGEVSCLSWTTADLKNAFRYSRTGAAKLMLEFTKSLAQTLRAANELLPRGPSSSAPSNGAALQLDELEMKRLQSFSVSRELEAGAVVFEEGSEGTELFVIVEGEVEIRKRTENGDAIPLATLGPGEFFGEMAFVEKSPRSASAVARSALKVKVLRSEVLDRVLEYNVGTALYLSNTICKILARRLNQTLSRIRA
jgi:CRP-like cAMP-binding protein